MTEMIVELPSREERKARQARLWHGAGHIKPAKREVSYFIPNTPFGVKKFREPPYRPQRQRIESRYPMNLEDERAWVIALCGIELPEPPAPKISVEQIQRLVAEHFGVERSDILSARRHKEIVLPRHVAMFLARKLTPKSLPEIGRRFGGRDHTTQISAQRKIERMMRADQTFAELVHGLATRLGGVIE